MFENWWFSFHPKKKREQKGETCLTSEHISSSIFVQSLQLCSQILQLAFQIVITKKKSIYILFLIHSPQRNLSHVQTPKRSWILWSFSCVRSSELHITAKAISILLFKTWNVSTSLTWQTNTYIQISNIKRNDSNFL